MTDQTIPADKVRAILDEWERIKEHADWEDFDNLVQDVRALLPAPTPPTLADMTKEERRACKWMQADVENRSVRYVIAAPDDGDGETTLIGPDGGISWFSPGRVTPRPDLPRLEWPDTEKPAPAPALPEGWRYADHKVYGRVIVTTPDPGCDGDVYFVYPETVLSLGFNSGWCDPDELTYIDQEADTTTGSNTPAVGDVIESADDPRIAALPYGSILGDRDGGPFDITKTGTGEWAGLGYVPAQGTGTKWGPWTVRRIGQEADQ